MSENASVTNKTQISAWVCLGLAWVLFLIPFPGTGFIGWPLNLVAFILAIVVMSKGSTVGGLIPLLSSLIVSPIVYFIGVSLMVGAYQEYTDEVQQRQFEQSRSEQTQQFSQ